MLGTEIRSLFDKFYSERVALATETQAVMGSTAIANIDGLGDPNLPVIAFEVGDFWHSEGAVI